MPDMNSEQELLRAAQAGDEVAFERLITTYRGELQAHAYRMVGSVHDAEDVMQEILLAAWRGLPGFEGRASLRTWLYRVATNRCLNVRCSRARRPPPGAAPPGVDIPEPTRLGEVSWLEPYPDTLLEGLADQAPSPEARYDAKEAISLAFITAVQLLPPRQCAVLILRDVLGFPAAEVADILHTTQESVTSAVKRARATLARQLASPVDREPPPAPGSALEQRLVARLTRAYAVGDVAEIVALLTDDVWLAMPPLPLLYQGRDVAARFLAAVSFREGRTYRVVPTRCNGQLALAAYARLPGSLVAVPSGLLVLTLAGDRIGVMTRFNETVLPRFGLPPNLAG
jgi:RNA polymerase sigma-70 factor (TIGR02960 family)